MTLRMRGDRRPRLDEVATAAKDADLFSGWTSRMENPDRVIRNEGRGEGVRLYEELERDWQVYSMLQTRALAVQGCEWRVEPASRGGDDLNAAALIRESIASAGFDRLVTDLMQAVLTGFKPVEILWEVSGGEVRVAEFRGRRPSRFTFDMDGGLRLLTLENALEGEPVPPRKFVVWTFGGHDWNPYGRGLGYQLYWPVWFKKNGVRFWMVFAEKFGSPTVLAKYPPGTPEADKKSLLDAIQAIQQQTGIRIPNTMDVSLLEATRMSSVNGYESLCAYMDRAIAKIVLGQTLTSEPGNSGSYALGKVHDGVRRDILKADADAVCECLNRTVVRWLVDFNLPASGRRGYPRVWKRTEPERDLRALAERDRVILADLGMGRRVPERYIEETYGIPLARGGEATVAPPRPEEGGGA